MQYNMREARKQLSKLVQSVLAGGDVIIARNGIPAARLLMVNTPDAMRKPGAWADLPKADEDWDAPIAYSKGPASVDARFSSAVGQCACERMVTKAAIKGALIQ